MTFDGHYLIGDFNGLPVFADSPNNAKPVANKEALFAKYLGQRISYADEHDMLACLRQSKRPIDIGEEDKRSNNIDYSAVMDAVEDNDHIVEGSGSEPIIVKFPVREFKKGQKAPSVKMVDYVKTPVNKEKSDAPRHRETENEIKLVDNKPQKGLSTTDMEHIHEALLSNAAVGQLRDGPLLRLHRTKELSNKCASSSPVTSRLRNSTAPIRPTAIPTTGPIDGRLGPGEIRDQPAVLNVAERLAVEEEYEKMLNLKNASVKYHALEVDREFSKEFDARESENPDKFEFTWYRKHWTTRPVAKAFGLAVALDLASQRTGVLPIVGAQLDSLSNGVRDVLYNHRYYLGTWYDSCFRFCKDFGANVLDAGAWVYNKISSSSIHIIRSRLRVKLEREHFPIAKSSVFERVGGFMEVFAKENRKIWLYGLLALIGVGLFCSLPQWVHFRKCSGYLPMPVEDMRTDSLAVTNIKHADPMLFNMEQTSSWTFFLSHIKGHNYVPSHNYIVSMQLLSQISGPTHNIHGLPSEECISKKAHTAAHAPQINFNRFFDMKWNVSERTVHVSGFLLRSLRDVGFMGIADQNF